MSGFGWQYPPGVSASDIDALWMDDAEQTWRESIAAWLRADRQWWRRFVAAESWRRRRDMIEAREEQDDLGLSWQALLDAANDERLATIRHARAVALQHVNARRNP